MIAASNGFLVSLSCAHLINAKTKEFLTILNWLIGRGLSNHRLFMRVLASGRDCEAFEPLKSSDVSARPADINAPAYG